MSLKIDLVYVYPGEQWLPQAFRFLNSYHEHPPAVEHSTVIMLNCARDEGCSLFETMRNCRFQQHDNSGYDIGAFQAAARASTADLIVFMGASAYARKAGWLLRMATAYQRRGNALYGCMGNQGDSRVNVFPHIRTTGFWLAPTLLNRYPHRVTKPEQRYPFEHGPQCLTEWVRRQSLRAFVCDWEAEYEWPNWDSIPNTFHRGNQSGLITGDHLSEPPYYHTP